MGKKLGRDFKLYHSATLITDASDAAIKAMAWMEAPTVADVSEDPSSATEIEFATRENGGQTQFFAGVFNEGLSFNLAFDKEDAFFTAIRDAFFARSEIALLQTDEAFDTAGAIGYAANFTITEFPRDLSLGQVAQANVTARPSSFINRNYEAPV